MIHLLLFFGILNEHIQKSTSERDLGLDAHFASGWVKFRCSFPFVPNHSRATPFISKYAN